MASFLQSARPRFPERRFPRCQPLGHHCARLGVRQASFPGQGLSRCPADVQQMSRFVSVQCLDECMYVYVCSSSCVVAFCPLMYASIGQESTRSLVSKAQYWRSAAPPVGSDKCGAGSTLVPASFQPHSSLLPAWFQLGSSGFPKLWIPKSFGYHFHKFLHYI